MSDFDHIKSLLAPQCPQLTARELDNLVYDVFVTITLADMPSASLWALRIGVLAKMMEMVPCE